MHLTGIVKTRNAISLDGVRMLAFAFFELDIGTEGALFLTAENS